MKTNRQVYMSEHLDQLQQAVLAFQEILLCKRRLEIISKELKQRKQELKVLKQVVDKEHQDVLALEKVSMKQLFTTLLINKEAQLEKERQEYLLAALKHNECHELIELLNYENKILQTKLRKEKEVIENFENLLTDLKHSKRKTVPKEMVLLKAINQELRDVILLKAEAKEALTIIKELKISFKAILAALKSAQLYDEWGFSYGQKQKAKVKKKQYIDQAQAQVYLVRKQLIFLRSELLDLHQFKASFSHAEGLIEDFNLGYYNDLITDWINVLKMDETIEHTMTTKNTIYKIARQLKELISKTDEEYQLLWIKRSTLIDQISHR